MWISNNMTIYFVNALLALENNNCQFVTSICVKRHPFNIRVSTQWGMNGFQAIAKCSGCLINKHSTDDHMHSSLGSWVWETASDCRLWLCAKIWKYNKPF